MTALRVTVKINILPGRQAEFRRIIAEISAVAREEKPGTQIFECYHGSDDVSAFIHEHFADNESFLAHGRNVAHLIGPLMEVASFGETIVAGQPSNEVRAAFSGGGDPNDRLSYYSPL